MGPLMVLVGCLLSDLFDSKLLMLTASETSLTTALSGSSPRQEEVRPQDTVSVIGGVAGSSKHGRKAAWKFVKDNWEELYNRYQGGFLISRLIKVKNLMGSCVRLISLSRPQTQITTPFYSAR